MESEDIIVHSNPLGEVTIVNEVITVRRERHWTTAGDKPARELDRSTR